MKLPIPYLLFLMIVLLQSASTQAQKISDEEIYFNVWHITNISLDSNTIINMDTLILRQALRSGHTHYPDSTTISPYDTWNISFGEYHDLTIYSVQRPPTGIGINRSEYYTEMYSCLNTVWSRNHKEIIFKIGTQPPVKYFIDQYSHLELILVKLE
ncbi:hypothetical protein [Fluviicola chungangensis]|uniref:Uncharacterized protein n=1 Tax=Fluviicola chungangensis TaxID=2597671 RepID=A0A556MMJ3_9FLAO|nr:hypothetical protein [Fluviicola chungangensis]TSJ41164.1 hypothetical protein FO442_14725 [Fluviicola chungangensis]